jgi:uncharacterized membrane protein
MGVSISKRPRRLLIAGIGAVVLAASSFAIATGPRFTEVIANPLITIGTGDLRPGEAKFFAYKDDAGKKLRFLLARDPNGNIVGAEDACEHCFIYGKGYRCSHGELICRYCGNRYKLNALGSGVASCVPVKMPFRMRGQTAEINPAELERNRGLF